MNAAAKGARACELPVTPALLLQQRAPRAPDPGELLTHYLEQQTLRAVLAEEKLVSEPRGIVHVFLQDWHFCLCCLRCCFLKICPRCAYAAIFL